MSISEHNVDNVLKNMYNIKIDMGLINTFTGYNEPLFIKYKTIIDYFQELGMRLISHSTNKIVIGIGGASGSTMIIIKRTLQGIKFRYKVNSIVFGDHELLWTFSENANQEYILELMNKEVGELNKKVAKQRLGINL